MNTKAIHQAADALRRHEQGSKKKLNDWHLISSSQRKKWLVKAMIVVEAYEKAMSVGVNV